jgi:hypothetical protein
MARFLQLFITSYDESGIPDLGMAEEQWINLDSIESVQERVADTFFHSVRYTPGLYPHLLLTLASGRELVVALGEHHSDDDARAVLKAAAHSLIG